MKQRVNITISEDVLEKAKNLARKRKSTLSALIESALNKLSKQESSKKLFSEYLRELPACKNEYPANFDFKTAYMEEKFGS
jgi:predicted transcriptional regulator